MRLTGPALALLLLAGCADGPAEAASQEATSLPSPYGQLTSDRWAWGAEYERRDLATVPNTNPDPEPQPHRDHPWDLALSPDGGTLYVTLAGNEAEPGSEVAVFDVQQRRVTGRIEVGSRPTYIDFHPSGAFALVVNQLSNYASVIDPSRHEVVAELPLDFYCNELVYSPDGRRGWVSNRYLDQVLELDFGGGG